MGEFDALDAAVNAKDRRLVIAAVLDWQLRWMATQQVGFLQQSGWGLAMRAFAKVAKLLLSDAMARPLKKDESR